MPRLNALYHGYRAAGLVVVGLNADRRSEAARKVAAQEIQYPCLFEAGSSHADYGVFAYPTTVLLDRAGRVRAQFAGEPRGGFTVLEQRVKALLAEG